MSRKIIHGLVVPNDRDREMYDYLFRGGHTLQECGDKYGITRERVRQLIDKCYGESNANNDVRWANSILKRYIKIRQQAEYARKQREYIFHKYFGCHEEIVTRINGEVFHWTKEARRSLAGEYIDQRRSALARKIPWKLNFREWWSLWDESGKYNERGRRKGQYVMARWGDTGAYELGNIYICKTEDNIKDIYKNKTNEELALIRLKRGWNQKKSHCKRGHELSGDNVYVWAKKGTRHCKTCDKMRKKIAYNNKHNMVYAQATA